MPRDDKGKVRVRVIDFEMEGSNQTLRDGIRDIVSTIAKTTATVRVLKPAALPALSGRVTDDDVDADAELGSSGEDESVSNSPRTRTVPRSPEVLDLDLTGGEEPLKPYLQKANLDNDANRYLLIAYWFKNFRSTSEVTMDHIHTAYRLMGWATPPDASMPLRSMKKRGYFKKGDGKGCYAINHIGDNRAMELAKSSS
jgi:hypothetical protein